MRHLYLTNVLACTFMLVPPALAQRSDTQATVASTESVRVGVFKQVQGVALKGKGSAEAQRPVGPGESVLLGDRLSTGSNGAASLTLKDGTVLTLGPNTSVNLSQFQFDTTTQEGHFALDLLQGTLRVVTGLLAKVNPERFRITTPTAVVGVRGTDFIVEAHSPNQVSKRATRRRHPTR